MMELFTAMDFDVFDISGFHDRMAAIAANVRPKLTGMGQELAPSVTDLVDKPVFVHVAKHARRKVNPPNDTWAALGTGKRGYKQDVHFKLAISRNCVRFLFEVGPEYYDKVEWALKWKREIQGITEAIQVDKQLGWFENEHDEDPVTLLAACSPEEVKALSKELTRRGDGQLVIGRRIDHKAAIRMKPAQFKRIALGTYQAMATLFSLHDQRVVV